MTPENALIYRRVFAIDRGRVVVEEKWDRYHPDCPFIDNPWNSYQQAGNVIIRQLEMTKEEFAAANPPLKQSPAPGQR